ncbi:hypothetical protein H0H93_013138 [Arthromyces matolae]|nr:hypothetical protein H0H93_013138 [Arthromyces matolae]
MATVTPGVAFILFQIHKLVIPSVLFGLLLRHLSIHGGFGPYQIPTLLVVLASILFIPALSIIQILWKTFDDRRQAAKLGARLARRIDGKLIGNVDILATMRRLWDTGYIGDGLVDWVGQGEPVVNIRILWSDLIMTVWPEHIKLILATDFQNYEKGIVLTHAPHLGVPSSSE